MFWLRLSVPRRYMGRPNLNFIYRLNVCVLVEALSSEKVYG